MNPRIFELLDKMTLEEKAALCLSKDNHSTALKKLNIDHITVCDGSHGLKKEIQKKAIHNGIKENIPATCFPCASAMAASWDISLMKKVGIAIAEECREEKVDILFGPALNVKRSPLCGKNYEYYSEDPYLSAEMAVSFIKGVQSRGVGACMKYFAVDSQEYRRMIIDKMIDQRALREIYLYTFEKAVKDAKPWCMMISPNKINGAYIVENRELLTGMIREEWRFDGMLVAERDAISDIISGISGGLDIGSTFGGRKNLEKIVQAVKDGRLAVEKLDAAVMQILELKCKINEKKSILYLYNLYANQKLAKIAARECIVLLKNKDKLLPLHRGDKITVIGEMAVKPRFQGTGSSMVYPTESLDVQQELLKFTNELIYARGYDTDSDEPNAQLENEALNAASASDIIVIFAGLPDRYEAEGFDRKHIHMPKNQNQLIDKIAALNENVVVVLNNGSPVAMPWIDKVKAVIEGYLTGQAYAGAISEILFGVFSPSGKLAESFPLKLEDIPSYHYFPGGPKTVQYRESIYVGYRYYQKAHKEILFPFGYGLSYTTFAYSDLTCSTKTVGRTMQTSVTLNIKNTGDFPGKEVVQIYVRDLQPRIFKPLMELKGFVKVDLQSGETKTVEIQIDPLAFSFFDDDAMVWKMYSGEYEIAAAASSEDIRLRTKIVVKAAEDFSPSLTINDIPSYYHLSNKKLSIPALEFKALCKKDLTGNEKTLRGEYSLESTLGEMKNTFAGRIIYKYAVKNQSQKHEGFNNKRIYIKKSKIKNPSILSIDSKIDEMPIKKLIIISEGRINHEMAQAILMMINKKKGGLKKFLKNYGIRK